MKEYLINVGEFNIIVLPEQRQYFILDGGEESADVQKRFVQGDSVPYDRMNSQWFPYEPTESWRDFNGKPCQLGEDVSENELIDMYVLKKSNFGGLVAVREGEGGKVRVFKRHKIPLLS